MMREIGGDLLDFFFPRLCLHCQLPLNRQERDMCLSCYVKLPLTGFVCCENNLVERLFYGRLKVYSANAFLNFRKSGIAQNLMHQLKYHNEKSIGIYLGKEFGERIKKTPNYNLPDVLISVPLHPEKERKRGYNQSDSIVEGMSETMGIRVDKDLLIRKQLTESQTLKKRFERWENISNSFEVDLERLRKYRHVGIVDDVITTGATMEACGTVLLQFGNIDISLFALCLAIK